MYEKKIWTFWHEPKVPSLMQVCINSWRACCPQYTVTVVNLDTYRQYIPRPMPDALKHMDIQFQADWIRTNLVYEHGGFWMDASIILNTDLDTLDQSKDFIGFLVPSDTPQVPQIENWFFGAPKQSPLLRDWIVEHERAIDMGIDAYIDASSVPSDQRYGMPYLWHQLCLTEALSRHPTAEMLLLPSLRKNSSIWRSVRVCATPCMTGTSPSFYTNYEGPPERPWPSITRPLAWCFLDQCWGNSVYRATFRPWRPCFS